MASSIRQLIDENIDKPIVIEVDPDDVSISGQKEIKSYMRHQGLHAPDYTFDWRHKSRRGTLAKRIAAWSYKNFEYKMSPEQKAYIGNIADRYRLYRDTFYIKFDTGMFWKLGDFGDPDSCYWQSKSSMRAFLNGSTQVYAMKIYEDPLFEFRWGRALLIMDCPDIESLLCINAYPKGFMVTNVGRILVKFGAMNELPLSTKHVSLVYHGSWTDYIWINGGNASLVTREGSTIMGESEFELANYVEFFKCMRCGIPIGRGKLVGRESQSIGYVCNKCAATELANCTFCGNTFLKDQLILEDKFGAYICTACISKIRHCTRCGEPFLFDRDASNDIWHGNVSRGAFGRFVFPVGFTCNECVDRYRSEQDRLLGPRASHYISFIERDHSDKYLVMDYNSYRPKVVRTVMQIRNMLHEPRQKE